MSSETEPLSLWAAQISYQQLLRWTNLAALLGLYYVCTIIYRLYFSPLSHIPGRKLAGMSNTFHSSPNASCHLLQSASPRTISNSFLTAATHLYPFYYDVICRGQYIWEVEKMHAQYGTLLLSFLPPRFPNING
jgi:hypothetical protein